MVGIVLSRCSKISEQVLYIYGDTTSCGLVTEFIYTHTVNTPIELSPVPMLWWCAENLSNSDYGFHTCGVDLSVKMVICTKYTRGSATKCSEKQHFDAVRQNIPSEITENHSSMTALHSQLLIMLAAELQTTAHLHFIMLKTCSICSYNTRNLFLTLLLTCSCVDRATRWTSARRRAKE